MKKKENIPDTAINKPDKKKGLTKKEEVPSSADKHIDQDFPGFPHAPAREKMINPKTPEDKVNANLKKKDTTPPADDDDDKLSVGSANAFEATENEEVLRAELEKNKKGRKKKSHY